MKKYQVWIEGFHCSGEGEYAKAHLVGEIEASSFQEACDILHSKCSTYDSKTLSDWGCRLFDNEKDAREIFG